LLEIINLLSFTDRAMSLNKQINEDLKNALKQNDTIRLSCLRMLKTAIKNMQVEKRRDLKEDEIQAVISTMIRKGREAAEEFRKGGREELARKEDQEIAIYYTYMPKQLTEEEIEKTLSEIISEISAKGLKDLGKVMGEAMARMTGKAQGKEISRIAKKILTVDK